MFFLLILSIPEGVAYFPSEDMIEDLSLEFPIFPLMYNKFCKVLKIVWMLISSLQRLRQVVRMFMILFTWVGVRILSLKSSRSTSSDSSLNL